MAPLRANARCFLPPLRDLLCSIRYCMSSDRVWALQRGQEALHIIINHHHHPEKRKKTGEGSNARQRFEGIERGREAFIHSLTHHPSRSETRLRGGGGISYSFFFVLEATRDSVRLAGITTLHVHTWQSAGRRRNRAMGQEKRRHQGHRPWALLLLSLLFVSLVHTLKREMPLTMQFLPAALMMESSSWSTGITHRPPHVGWQPAINDTTTVTCPSWKAVCFGKRIPPTCLELCRQQPFPAVAVEAGHSNFTRWDSWPPDVTLLARMMMRQRQGGRDGRGRNWPPTLPLRGGILSRRGFPGSRPGVHRGSAHRGTVSPQQRE